MSGRILLKNIFLDMAVNITSFSAELPELVLGDSKEDFWQQLEQNNPFLSFSSSFSPYGEKENGEKENLKIENGEKGNVEIEKYEKKKAMEWCGDIKKTDEQFACWCCGLFFDEKSWGIPIFTSKDTQIMKSPFTTSFNVGRNIIHLPAAQISTNYLHPTNELKYNYKPHNDLLDGIHREEVEMVRYYGNFCTIFCAIRYLQETEEFTKNCKENYKNILYLLFSKQCKKKVFYIPPSLPKTLMKIYSGNMGLSEAEYKNANKALEKQII